MNLNELLAKLPKAAPAKAIPPAVNTMSLPWWVVMLSQHPKPDGSPQLKFDFGFATQGEAEQRCRQRQEEADREAHRLTNRDINEAINRGTPADSVRIREPMQFYVIERPPGAKL